MAPGKVLIFCVVQQNRSQLEMCRDSMTGGGLKLKILCRQCIHSFKFGGFDVRKLSDSPKREIYHSSKPFCGLFDAIFLPTMHCSLIKKVSCNTRHI